MAACRIETHASSFRRGAKAAAKRHRSFPEQLQKLFAEIEKDPYGQGDAIASSNVSQVIRKVRIGCPLERVQPRAGYRLIYQIIETKDGIVARCIDLFYKPEQNTIRANEVERLAKLALPAENASEG